MMMIYDVCVYLGDGNVEYGGDISGRSVDMTRGV